MRWCSALGLAVLCVLVVTKGADAQQSARVWHLGILSGEPPTESLPVVTPFLDELRNLGYADGHNLVIERRWAEAKEQKLRSSAAELARNKVDVIVAITAASVIAAKQVIMTIPIVMIINSDPVETGLVASYARPGGNVTGFSPITPELAGKRLELLRDIVPGIRRVAVLWEPIQAKLPDFGETRVAAQSLGLELQSWEVRDPGDFAASFAAASADRPDALLTLGSPITVIHRAQIIDFAARSRLPAMYDKKEFAIDGGLMAYIPSPVEHGRRTAAYVDKIFKGAKPADLPVEQPTKFELVINLNTAKALGLTIPPSILARADEVIE
jgi:putative tryptophan/tyrosine transport system substrate-binding protein